MRRALRPETGLFLGMTPALLRDWQAGEAFLESLSRSRYQDHLVLKGGRALKYLIAMDRPSRDMDFTVYGLSSDQPFIGGMTQEIAFASNARELRFLQVDTQVERTNPYLVYRHHLAYVLQGMVGRIQIDMPFEPLVGATRRSGSIPRLRLRVAGGIVAPFEVWTQPPENMFAEKFHALVKAPDIDQRIYYIRFYYHLFKLIQSGILGADQTCHALKQTFIKRRTRLPETFSPVHGESHTMQMQWERFIERENLRDVPWKFSATVRSIDRFYARVRP